jgi:O-succinylbenzoic acid--CoA ligase
MVHGINFLANTAEQRIQLEEFLLTWNSPSPTFEVNTSGSTGKPKTMLLSKSACIESAKRTIAYFALNPGDRAYLCLSLDTIAGKMMVIRALVGSLNLYVGPVSRDSLLYLPEEINFCAVVPLQLNYALDHYPEHLNKVNYILVGGAGLNAERINVLKSQQLTIFQSYGMTETLSHIALKRSGYIHDEWYTTLPGVHLQQRNGTLVINDLVTGVKDLVTTDAVELISENSFKFIGRTNLMINSGGVKLAVETIEQLCSPIITAPFFIIGTPDIEFGECVTLVIEGETPYDIVFPELTFPLYHQPRKILFIKPFHYTLSGKIDRIKTMEAFNSSNELTQL